MRVKFTINGKLYQGTKSEIRLFLSTKLMFRAFPFPFPLVVVSYPGRAADRCVAESLHTHQGTPDGHQVYVSRGWLWCVHRERGRHASGYQATHHLLSELGQWCFNSSVGILVRCVFVLVLIGFRFF